MTPPLNITLSLGDVSFHLSPSSQQSSTSNNYTQQYSPAISSPSARRTTSSPYNNSRRRVRRTNNQQHISSPPIVSIRHGGGSLSNMPSNNHASPATNNIGHSPPYTNNNNNSPLQNHIRGRVRAMKNKIEAPQSAISQQAPPANSNTLGGSNSVKRREDEYCVDLNGFTGTLYITSRGDTANMPQSTPQQKENTTRWEDNRVLLSSPRPNSMRNSKLHSSSGRRNSLYSSSGRRHSSVAASPSFLFASSTRKRLTGDENVQLSNKRAYSPSSSSSNINNNEKKDGFTWIASNSNDETVEVGRVSDVHDENKNQFEDTAATAVTQVNNKNSNRHLDGGSSSKKGGSEKAVRFSMLAHKLSDNSMIPNKTFSIDSGDEESQTTTAITTSVHQQGTPQQQLQPRQKSKHFFTSPPPCTASFTTSSPPRTALSNVLSETSSMLARSSKHMLKTVTLAGKDVMDQLSGENGGPSSVRGVSSTSNKQSSNGSNRAAVQVDSSMMNNVNNDEDQTYDAFDGTELHYACASESLEHAQSLLEYDTCEDLHKMDCTGKLPIHVFCENFSLISSDPDGCEDVALTMIELMGPKESVQALHPNGLSPFVYIIGRWTEKLHQDVFLLKNSVMGSVQAMRISTTSNKVNGEPMTSAALTGQSTDHSPTRPQHKRLPYRSLFHSSTVNEKSLVSSNDRAKLLYLPDHVTIPAHVQWAIQILSLLIDRYPEQCRESILTNIASVPLFLKSILLVSDTDEMAGLLDTTLVKHCVMDKRSINVWLCSMLTADTRDVKMRATVFIKLISKLSLQDLNASSQSPSRYSDEEQSRFITLREEVFYAVYSQPGIVPAVLELGGRLIEHISTTKVMRYITDKTIRKDSVFFVLILDFFYSIFLLIGYRLNVEYVLNYNNVDGPEIFRDERYISTSTMGIIASYFLIKEGLTLLSLYLTSTKLAKRYCFSIFKIIDVVSVAMLLATESILSTDPTLLDNEGFAASLTIILLWLKLMFAFKVLNSSFALFLYAVNEVIKEIKWFIIFLFGITLMFSDAARTIVAARGDCQYNIDGEQQVVAAEFCSDNLMSVIIRMYSVLVGDVALEYFESSDAMTAVFVFFSFFSIIILLNILIAIIIDSYDSSKQRSREIFYRARIEYAAHLAARKQFLTPRECSDFHVATYVPKTARKSLRIIYFLVIALAFLAAEYGFFGMLHFLTLEDKHDYRMVRSLVWIYVVIGSIFNVYVISVASIGLFSRYDKRYVGLKWLTGDRHTIHGFIKRVIELLKVAVNLFHDFLGFNADRETDWEDPEDSQVTLPRTLSGNW